MAVLTGVLIPVLIHVQMALLIPVLIHVRTDRWLYWYMYVLIDGCTDTCTDGCTHNIYWLVSNSFQAMHFSWLRWTVDYISFLRGQPLCTVQCTAASFWESRNLAAIKISNRSRDPKGLSWLNGIGSNEIHGMHFSWLGHNVDYKRVSDRVLATTPQWPNDRWFEK